MAIDAPLQSQAVEMYERSLLEEVIPDLSLAEITYAMQEGGIEPNLDRYVRIVHAMVDATSSNQLFFGAAFATIAQERHNGAITQEQYQEKWNRLAESFVQCLISFRDIVARAREEYFNTLSSFENVSGQDRSSVVESSA